MKNKLLTCAEKICEALFGTSLRSLAEILKSSALLALLLFVSTWIFNKIGLFYALYLFCSGFLEGKSVLYSFVLLSLAAELVLSLLPVLLYQLFRKK